MMLFFSLEIYNLSIWLSEGIALFSQLFPDKLDLLILLLFELGQFGFLEAFKFFKIVVPGVLEEEQLMLVGTFY